jgi:hypothetical protein
MAAAIALSVEEGVGVGDTVEIWFFGGLSVGYRNLAERLKLSCPFQEHFYP